ncbi:unnamed protein product, partial [Closterium sp. NIES-64]
DADDALRLEREAERICQLECQLADKAKALGQSECERVVLERQLADKASQLGQSERRRVRLEQQLEERSREVREARMQLARLQAQAWAEPAGQARQIDLWTGAAAPVAGARAADGSAFAAPSASYAPDAAAASCVGAWAAAASHAAATPAFEEARQNSAQVLAREAMCAAAQSSLEAEGATGAGDAAGSVFEQLGEQQCERTGRLGPGVAEAGRECEMAALVEENGRLEAERNRAEEERVREEEKCARMGEEMRELRGNLQEAEALCWQRQAQLEEALSEVAAGRRERGALEEELLRLQCALDHYVFFASGTAMVAVPSCLVMTSCYHEFPVAGTNKLGIVARVLPLCAPMATARMKQIVVKLLMAYFQRNPQQRGAHVGVGRDMCALCRLLCAL